MSAPVRVQSLDVGEAKQSASFLDSLDRGGAADAAEGQLARPGGTSNDPNRVESTLEFGLASHLMSHGEGPVDISAFIGGADSGDDDHPQSQPRLQGAGATGGGYDQQGYAGDDVNHTGTYAEGAGHEVITWGTLGVAVLVWCCKA